MEKRFYFPVRLEDGLAVIRKHKRLEKAMGVAHGHIIGYTDRACAVLAAKEAKSDSRVREVTLVVIEVDKGTAETLFMGDFQHHGPCVAWVSNHAMRFDQYAQEWLSHEGRYSLEVVSG